ncbi:T9SS type A sorting domain-containing protein [Lacinutrix salivirga]
MKKITLLITCLAFCIGTYAQQTCATAQAVTAGTTTVAMVDGTEVPLPECAANEAEVETAAEWFSFTATVDGIANITTDLAVNAGGDTRLHVYTGTCGALTCLAGNDDVDPSAGVQNYLSEVTFAVETGVTYIFAFDDTWSDAGFDFTLTETPVDCSTTSPYTYDFADINPLIACYTIEDANADATTWGYNNGNDFDGDFTNDAVGLIFPQAANIEKDDWLFLPVFNGVTGGEYTFNVIYNVFNNPAPAAMESFDIVVTDTPSAAAASQTVLGTYNNITQSGELATLIQNAYSSSVTYTPTTDGDFYFAIRATTPAANSGILLLFELSVQAVLSVDEFSGNSIKHYYNSNTNSLHLESTSVAFTNIEVYDILGKQILAQTLNSNEESVSLGAINNGVYIAKVSTGNGTKTLKFVKN